MREQKHRGHLVSDRLIGAHLRCGCQVGWPAQISRLWAAVSVRACGDHGMQAGLTAVLRLLCDQAWLRRVPATFPWRTGVLPRPESVASRPVGDWSTERQASPRRAAGRGAQRP
jgi:hypothetical protein